MQLIRKEKAREHSSPVVPCSCTFLKVRGDGDFLLRANQGEKGHRMNRRQGEGDSIQSSYVTLGTLILKVETNEVVGHAITAWMLF